MVKIQLVNRHLADLMFVLQSIELFDSFSRWMLEADAQLLFTFKSGTKKGSVTFGQNPISQ